MTILVTGGAGYIGSHVVKALGLRGEKLVILDNLSTGRAESVLFGELVVGDVGDSELLEKLFQKHRFEAVLHFAGSVIISESVASPMKYYRNNTRNSEVLLEACAKWNVKHLVFSSTCAVYGIPTDGICREESALNPINPYGHSKLMVERMIWDLTKTLDMRAVALRYFNVAGADPEGKLGQCFPQATFIVKVAAEVACGKREAVKIHGTDYPTPDGTCIRDYIHVTDLAEAHVLALEYLRRGGETTALNCGYGRGYSVREVVERVKAISGVNFKVLESERRPGDPPTLIAEVGRIGRVFGWKPQHASLDFMIETALRWERGLSS